ncbi:MAG: MaoC family dehydratase [Pseudomonadota bacterium]
MAESWPRALTRVSGPMRADKLAGAAQGMGAYGPQTVLFAQDDLVPPDMMTGLTLFILAQQPRDTDRQKIPGGGGGVAGGVWVRERFTISRPLARDEVFTVDGTSLGRHVHKGRRYGTTAAVTRNAAGELSASNLTTGLLAYEVEDGLADGVEGQPVDEIEAPAPDWSVAAHNPCRAALLQLTPGERLGGETVRVSLAMMAARDTKRPDNPIHSDPELARKAGLSRPIAGGSHVLSFALEPIFVVCGRDALFHGANFDVRWKAPVYADTDVLPRVTVAAKDDRLVTFDLQVDLADGAAAMVARVTVPLA